jgi:hypothetical protein
VSSKTVETSGGNRSTAASHAAAAVMAEAPLFQCSFGFANSNCQSVPDLVGMKMRFILSLQVRSNGQHNRLAMKRSGIGSPS